MASILSGCMAMPVSEIMCPRNETVRWKNEHLDGLILRLALGYDRKRLGDELNAHHTFIQRQ